MLQTDPTVLHMLNQWYPWTVMMASHTKVGAHTYMFIRYATQVNIDNGKVKC